VLRVLRYYRHPWVGKSVRGGTGSVKSYLADARAWLWRHCHGLGGALLVVLAVITARMVQRRARAGRPALAAAIDRALEHADRAPRAA
jgi:dolichyl-phosphate-mannose--protein O-mannosyl transferase